ncbi:hypothetical protein [Bartonella schoenbuchensis]|nr:hypothetical protein [Bartonella schoenbuchensis]
MVEWGAVFDWGGGSGLSRGLGMWMKVCLLGRGPRVCAVFFNLGEWG